MTNPPIEERKSYWKWAYATRCFSGVKTTIEYVQRNERLNNEIEQILLSGIVVTYGKPFTKCFGVGNLNAKIIPKFFLKEHNAIMELRHMAVAHLDAMNFKADDLDFGNLNKVIIFKNKGEYGFSVTGYDFKSTLLNFKIYELCLKLIEKAQYHTKRFEAKYICVPGFPKGEFFLNVEPQDCRPFISIPQKFKGKFY